MPFRVVLRRFFVIFLIVITVGAGASLDLGDSKSHVMKGYEVYLDSIGG